MREALKESWHFFGEVSSIKTFIQLCQYWCFTLEWFSMTFLSTLDTCILYSCIKYCMRGYLPWTILLRTGFIFLDACNECQVDLINGGLMVTGQHFSFLSHFSFYCTKLIKLGTNTPGTTENTTHKRLELLILENLTIKSKYLLILYT